MSKQKTVKAENCQNGRFQGHAWTLDVETQQRVPGGITAILGLQASLPCRNEDTQLQIYPRGKASLLPTYGGSHGIWEYSNQQAFMVFLQEKSVVYDF